MFKALLVLVLVSLVSACALVPERESMFSDSENVGDVLFWSLEKRDSAFRTVAQFPHADRAARIKAGKLVRDLPLGDPLKLDVSEFVEQTRVAGLLIVQNGKIRAEHYGLGLTPEDRWSSFSVAKSITSTLVGAAIQDGYIEHLSDPVSKYVKGLQGSAYDDVTIEQLLTMTSGVAWSEDYTDPESDVARFGGYRADPDEAAIVSYLKTLPRAYPAGEKWNYSTGETNLIGVLISEATHKTLAEYASEKIWSVYGMEADAFWRVGADGNEISGCCVNARIRDFARFGIGILENNRGTVPVDWIAKATKASVATDYPGVGYGYQWWTGPRSSFQALGIFGQSISVFPEHNLVVVINSSWRSATGLPAQGGGGNETMLRASFLQRVVAAIDAEQPER